MRKSSFFNSHRPLHIDTTYTIIRQRAVSVFGTTDFRGQFTPIGLALTMNDQISDYQFIFRSIRENIASDYKPEKLVSIPVPAIQLAARNVFGNFLIFCLKFSCLITEPTYF